MDFEEKIAYLQQKEQRSNERLQTSVHENDLMKAEIKNMLIKLQVLEHKVDEASHLENAFLELQKDYDELVKEKAQIVQSYENQIFYLKDEGRDAKGTAAEHHRNAVKAKKDVEDMQRECYQMDRSRAKLQKENSEMAAELITKNRLLEEKNQKLEQYNEEVSNINKKILEFNVLMERLIQENQRLNLLTGEGGKSDRMKMADRPFLERVKINTSERDPMLKPTSTLKNFRSENLC